MDKCQGKGIGIGISVIERILKTEILKDVNEHFLRDKVNEFIKDKKDVKLTWQAMKSPGWMRGIDACSAIMFICFIEYKE